MCLIVDASEAQTLLVAVTLMLLVLKVLGQTKSPAEGLFSGTVVHQTRGVKSHQ